MQRDPALIPLSQQHHDALALSVYIERANKSGHLDVAYWNREVSASWKRELRWHFQSEEEILFPAASRVETLRPVVEQLLAQHAALRVFFAAAERGTLSADDLLRFRQSLTVHVRKEERELFEGMQAALAPEDLAATGKLLNQFFDRNVGGVACALRPPQPQPNT
jgi:iron-sulfur cluster repair protein YtfE (RIC family)